MARRGMLAGGSSAGDGMSMVFEEVRKLGSQEVQCPQSSVRSRNMEWFEREGRVVNTMKGWGRLT